MHDYDFLNLSPYEFEILTRDLLQKKLDLYLESFGDGIDQGIDLRYSEAKGLIIQCKKYKDFNSLLSNLKRELVKVKALNPDRYIISTSVSLLPGQKDKIINLFDPYILNSTDIYGRQDLNNLLTQFPDIEKNFYKLWLSSSTVLQEIVNSQVVNQSKFVKDEIQEKIKIYVQNKSFSEAISILKQTNHVIISGIPGIGKTTLAEMLVFHLLSNGIEEFIFLSDSINNGFELFNESKKQVFLFDDFLGRNFLQHNIATNEEKQILRFIKRIQNSSNKLLIFTTREYILNQAKQKFEDLEKADFSKCILDLSKYSTLDKAQILYNHMFVNNIPFKYVNEILKQGALFKIINHRNYNPRIIESFTNSKIWTKIKEKEFPAEIIRLFDNPFLIWEHVYENQISELSKILLDCLLIVEENVEYYSFYQQIEKYTQINYGSVNSTLNNHTFKASLKELENSLIKIRKNPDNSLSISYQNPSIQDFIVNYISNEPISKQNLMDSILFISPALNIISVETDNQSSKNKILLNKEETIRIEQHIINSFDNMLFSTKNYAWSKPSNDDIEFLKLNRLMKLPEKSQKLEDFIKKRFLEKVYSENITNKSIADYISLFEYFHDEVELDLSKVISNISGAFWSYDDLQHLYIIKELYPDEFGRFQEENEEVYNDIFTYIVEEISDEDSEKLESYEDNIGRLKELGSNFNYWVDDAVEKVKDKIEKLKLDEEDYMFDEEDEYDYVGRHRYYLDHHDRETREVNIESSILRQEKSEEQIITDIFKSLE